MCGILGILSARPLPEFTIRKFPDALRKIRHRGPDHSEIMEFAHSIFGHNRLSIIDPEASSNQPFVSDCKQKIIVYNGEIFNFQQLRQELISLGYTFSTKGDVEVLLKGLEAEGVKFIEKLEGFFSFVFYDKKSDYFIAARDRFGVKPFYYSVDKSHFVFSSEIRPLLFLSENYSLNFSAIQLYFSLNYIPGELSIVNEIKKLEPGSVCFGSPKNFAFKKYYQLTYSESSSEVEKEEFMIPKINSLLENAVNKRLISDVPIGCFLSGGIDSSLIAALASKNQKGLNTFTIGFKSESQYNEADLAEKTAKFLNTNHHTFLLNEDEFLHHIDDFLDSMDEPFADSSAFNMFMLSKYTATHLKVVLSGDGADELFGGYNKHRAMWRMQNPSICDRSLLKLLPIFKLLPSGRSGFVKNKIRQIVRYSTNLQHSRKDRYWNLATFSDYSEVQNLLLTPYSEPKIEAFKSQILDEINDDFNSVLATDFKLVLEGDMLVKIDRMSMAHGLEVRSPFLDHDLVNYVMNIPAEKKLNSYSGKLLLRTCGKGLVLDEVFQGSKKGFEVPLENWFQNKLSGKLKNQWLSDEVLENQKLVNKEEVFNLLRKLRSSNPGNSAYKLWTVIIILRWLNKNFNKLF